MDRCSSNGSYILSIVNVGSAAGRTRRWQRAVAIAAALSLFVALIAGSSLRPQLAAAALPEPAVWTHASGAVQAHAGQVQHAQPISRVDHGLSPGSTNKKPFHSMWMTRGRPTGWADVAPHAGWLALPASFAASKFQPDGAQRASEPARVDRDILTMLGLLRC